MVLCRLPIVTSPRTRWIARNGIVRPDWSDRRAHEQLVLRRREILAALAEGGLRSHTCPDVIWIMVVVGPIYRTGRYGYAILTPRAAKVELCVDWRMTRVAGSCIERVHPQAINAALRIRVLAGS